MPAMGSDQTVAMGRRLRSARLDIPRSQGAIGRDAGVSQSVVSRMELGHGGNIDLDTWCSVARAVGLRVTFEAIDAEDATREDGTCRRMVADLATRGGWSPGPGSIETILTRADDVAVIQAWDLVTSVRSDTESGVVVIPATGANRRRITELRDELRDTFPARPRDWYAALVNPHRPMPAEPGILWAFPDCLRLRPATFRPGWIWTAVGDGPRFATGRRIPKRR